MFPTGSGRSIVRKGSILDSLFNEYKPSAPSARQSLAEAVAEDMGVKVEYQPQNGISVRLKGAALPNGKATLPKSVHLGLDTLNRETEFIEHRLGYHVMDVNELLESKHGFNAGVLSAKDFEGPLKDPRIFEEFKREIQYRNDLLVIMPMVDNITFESSLNCLDSLITTLSKDEMTSIRENAILSGDGIDANDTFVKYLHSVRHSMQANPNAWQEIAWLFAKYTKKIDTNAHVNPNTQFYQDNQYSFIGSNVTIGPLATAVEHLHEKLEGDKMRMSIPSNWEAEMTEKTNSILKEMEAKRKAREERKAAVEKALVVTDESVDPANNYYRVFNVGHLKDSGALNYFLKGLKDNTDKDNRIAVLNFNRYEGDIAEACRVMKEMSADYSKDGLWMMAVHRTKAGKFKKELRGNKTNTNPYCDNRVCVYEQKDYALVGLQNPEHLGRLNQLMNLLGKIQVNGEITIEDVESANPELVMPRVTKGSITSDGSDYIAQRDELGSPGYDSSGYDSRRSPLRMIEPNPDSNKQGFIDTSC